MRRGELYRVFRGNSIDPKDYRVFVIVSRQLLIDSKHSTVICAPVFSSHADLSTQVPIGVDESLKHDSAIHCDELVSILKSKLTHYVGVLSASKLRQLDAALATALQLKRLGVAER